MANNKELHMEQVVKLPHQAQADMEHQELPLDMDQLEDMDQDLELHMDNQPPAAFPHQDKEDINHHTKEPLEDQVLTPQVQAHQADHHQDTASRLKSIEI